MASDTRTATQKIEDLERVVTALYQNITQHKAALESLLQSQGDMALIKNALGLLNKKTEAMVQLAAPETGISAESVNSLVVKMNVADLQAQTQGLVASGHLVSSEAADSNSFLVAEELDADGVRVNPRVQFRLDSQEKSTVEALTGKKAGDLVFMGENKFSLKLLEVYSIVDEPKAAEAAASAETPAATEAAAVNSEAAPETAAAPESAAPAQALDPLPAESPVPTFLNVHGQADPAMATA